MLCRWARPARVYRHPTRHSKGRFMAAMLSGSRPRRVSVGHGGAPTIRPVHVLIPYVHTGLAACDDLLPQLPLPQWRALLSRLHTHPPLIRDDFDRSTPLECVLAQAYGWPIEDGGLPFAALLAAQAGLPLAGIGWGRLTPMHWHAGRDHLTAVPLVPDADDEADLRELFVVAQDVFTSVGWRLEWLHADTWLLGHASLVHLPTASVDRVLHRNPDAWMPDHPAAGTLKRLQMELQMLWYEHPVNDRRSARGALPINTVWLSDCGAYRAPQAGAEHDVVVVDVLRRGCWRGDAQAWAQGWQHIETDIADMLRRRLDEGQDVCVTLCALRASRTWGPQGRPWWRRLVGARHASDWVALAGDL